MVSPLTHTRPEMTSLKKVSNIEVIKALPVYQTGRTEGNQFHLSARWTSGSFLEETKNHDNQDQSTRHLECIWCLFSSEARDRNKYTTQNIPKLTILIHYKKSLFLREISSKSQPPHLVSWGDEPIQTLWLSDLFWPPNGGFSTSKKDHSTFNF